MNKYSLRNFGSISHREKTFADSNLCLEMSSVQNILLLNKAFGPTGSIFFPIKLAWMRRDAYIFPCQNCFPWRCMTFHKVSIILGK